MSATLQHGPYLTPLIVKGARLVCGFRGVVRIVGLSMAPIPWPIGKRDGKRALVVYRGLARALRTESADAIAAPWGVPAAKVTEWQAAAIEKPSARYVHNGSTKRVWTPEEDTMRSWARSSRPSSRSAC